MDIEGLKHEVEEPKFYPDFNFDPISKIKTALSDNDLDSLGRYIKSYHRYFLSDAFILNRENREVLISLFSDVRFIGALVDELSNIQLNDDEIISINKVVYDFKCQREQTSDIRYRLLVLSRVVNRDLCAILDSIVSEDIADNLALVRRSSYKENENIRRCNYILIKYCNNISPQAIEKIYGYLFKNTRFSIVFNTVMYDVWPDSVFDNEMEYNMYKIIYNIVLRIVDIGMTTNDIRTILINYLSIYQAGKSTRFKIREIDQNKYPRLKETIQFMEIEGYIFGE